MTVNIPLSKKGKHAGRFVAVVDDADADLSELNWSARYVVRERVVYAFRHATQPGPVTYLHRTIAARMFGNASIARMEIDHIDRDGLNNRRLNLRLSDRSQNISNRGKPVNNKSGYKGVGWSIKSGKWTAQIIARGSRIYLGLFESPEDAARAYDEAAREHHGEFAVTNF